MQIKILGSAKSDLIEGYAFYEKQKDGLGSYFLETLLSDIDSLQIFAGVHSIHYSSYYRLLSKRFPFAVYYKISDETVFIYAVLDCRRDPAWIRKRL